MYDSIRTQCRFITENYNRIFLRKRNVVGMGFGYKISKGIKTGELCFKVFVAKKESQASLNYNDLVPKTYKGMKTDVIQTGQFTHSALSEKNLPLKFGYSIGANGTRATGTAGCLVKDCCGNYYILSNNHVLSDLDSLPIGTPILHPGVYDGGKYPEDVIAYLSKTIPLINYNPEEDDEENYEKFYNRVDCAIAKIEDSCLVTKGIALIGGVKGICDAKLDLKVKKAGRTTELTAGIITELDCLTEITTSKETIQLFDNQIITTYMSTKGDSGSLVLDENNNAIGLLYGDSDSYTMLNPIKDVLKALNVSIVTC